MARSCLLAVAALASFALAPLNADEAVLVEVDGVEVKVIVSPATAAATSKAIKQDAANPSKPPEIAICDDGASEDAPCEATQAAAATTEGAEVDASEEPSSDDENVVRPTHKQTKVITVNPSQLDKTKLKSFCLAPTGEILAACTDQIRVFNAEGEHQTTWEISFAPEAINVGSDGCVYVAGEGKLARLTMQGEQMSLQDSPLSAELMKKKDQMREDMIAQQKKMVERYTDMRKRYAKTVEELEARKAEVEAAAQADEANTEESEAEVAEDDKETIEFSTKEERKLANAKRMVEQMERILERQGSAELTEEEVDKRVRSSLKSKMAVASISEADGEVFMATRAPTGHGYAVWRMSRHFDSAEMIVSGLRGCCGQMDVQSGENGVYVAENSRARVCRYDRSGKLICTWGKSAREGLVGFGSCCNPMNVAFGPEGTVYTAESGSGRIKRYSKEGKLIELVGKVDIVPGCKKVSIAASADGDRIYMLDITRDHIVMMQRMVEGEETDYYEVSLEDPSAKPAAGATSEPAAEQAAEQAVKQTAPASSEAKEQTVTTIFRSLGRSMSQR